MKLPIKKLHPAVELSYATDGSAALDLRAMRCTNALATSDLWVVPPGQTRTFGTGIAVDLGAESEKQKAAALHHASLEGTATALRHAMCEIERITKASSVAALILPRSGLGCKHNLRPANSPGLIDPDYRGELLVCLHNGGTEPYTVTFGERIAQLLIIPVLRPQLEWVEELGATARGDGGLGSTGR